MKRDGRKFDHRTLEAIRLMAVERVRDGEAPSSVIASYGLCRTTIYKWRATASKPGVGLHRKRHVSVTVLLRMKLISRPAASSRA